MLEVADEANPSTDTGPDSDERIARLEAEIRALGLQVAAQLGQLRMGDDAGWLAFALLNLRQSELRVDVATYVLAQAEASGDEQWINASRQVLLFTGMVRASNRQLVARYEGQLS